MPRVFTARGFQTRHDERKDELKCARVQTLLESATKTVPQLSRGAFNYVWPLSHTDAVRDPHLDERLVAEGCMVNRSMDYVEVLLPISFTYVRWQDYAGQIVAMLMTVFAMIWGAYWVRIYV